MLNAQIFAQNILSYSIEYQCALRNSNEGLIPEYCIDRLLGHEFGVHYREYPTKPATIFGQKFLSFTQIPCLCSDLDFGFLNIPVVIAKGQIVVK